MPEALLKINNCIDCPYHKIIADPDPEDWFCDDDVMVICTLTKENTDYNPNSKWVSDRQNEHRCVTVSCRPYRVDEESDIPDWCPLMNENKEVIV